MNRKIIIYGAGAIGCVLAAAAMQNNDNDVEVYVRAATRSIMLKNGISISGIIEKDIKPVFFESKHSNQNKLYVLTVKAYDLENAIKEIKPFLTADDCLLLIQNGYGIKELVSDLLKDHLVRSNIFQAISAIGATLLSPGKVNYYGGGLRIESEFKNTDFSKTWQDSFLNYEYSSNFNKDLWRKLVINSIVNPLTALLDISNACLAKKEYNNVKNQILEESLLIARSVGINIELTLDKFNSFIDSDNISSMLQDFKKRDRTEIDFINGALVKVAQENGIAAPVNQFLRDLVKIKSHTKDYVNG